MTIGLVAADWPAAGPVIAGTTLRSGGVSEGAYTSLNLGAHVGDDERRVAENRRRLIEQLALPGEPRWLRQVHGTEVVRDPLPGSRPQADAAVTSQPGSVCAVLTADCLPVLLCDVDGREVAAAHAGWRGLLAGVLEKTVSAMDSDRLLAWLGPGISQAAFEVGAEVRAAFVEHDPASGRYFRENDRGRWQADLYGLARQRLAAVGVHDVHGGGRCTYSEADAFFSFRRDGQCGRMASFIVISAVT